MELYPELRGYPRPRHAQDLVQVLIVRKDSTQVGDYYVSAMPAERGQFLGGRRVEGAIEWARVRGVIAREDAGQAVIVLDPRVFTRDEGTARIAEFDLR